MRVLLDENLPHDLAAELGGHDVSTVQGLGWTGVKNGELLQRAGGRIDVLLTMDRRLEQEHELSTLTFGVLVIRAKSNRLDDLLPTIPNVLAALERVAPGTVEHVHS